MNVSYNFKCSWNSTKKNKVSQLIKERILLLVGVKVFEKISNINFCDMSEVLNKSFYYKTSDNIANLYVSKASDINSYEININKDILLTMTKPGIGQSIFDNIFVEFRSIIQSTIQKS